MARQLITFHLGTQSFGLDIMAIREIRAWSPTTRLPHVPHYVAGVVNLRGTVLPVIDLAARLGWEPTSPTERQPPAARCSRAMPSKDSDSAKAGFIGVDSQSSSCIFPFGRSESPAHPPLAGNRRAPERPLQEGVRTPYLRQNPAKIKGEQT